MTEVHFTERKNLYEGLEARLAELLSVPFEIRRSANGKPYIEGDPLFFSISHSGDKAVFAISDSPVGVDMEFIKGRNRLSVISRFSARERAEICGEKEFICHWTAREAYIKMKGGTLTACLKKLEFYGGEMYDGGIKCNCVFQFIPFKDGVAAICTQNTTEV